MNTNPVNANALLTGAGSGQPWPQPSRWLLVALTLYTFLFMLGVRSLNEPDEGRYAEIAREMLETGDWLVPKLWYVPHLDKPPLTYWTVALAMRCFGQNEWAARLPLALAALSGVGAAYLLGVALGGRRVGAWSAMILQTSVLYVALSRVLTPDMLFTQFMAWTLYCGWRAWRSLDEVAGEDEERRARAGRRCFGWHLGAWSAMALGFLTKGPMAVIIPALLGGILGGFRRRERHRWPLLVLGNSAGLFLFAVIVAPWFLAVSQALPEALDYLSIGQFVGHALGTTIQNRSRPFYYFLPILIFGFLPWTLLLGWLWRRSFWRGLRPEQQDGWLLLSSWVGVTLLLFTLSSAKRAPYILPMFPALALLVAWRWTNVERPTEHPEPPAWVWRTILLIPWLMLVAAPALVLWIQRGVGPLWLWALSALMLAGLPAWWFAARTWPVRRCVQTTVAMMLLAISTCAVFAGMVADGWETNATLKPIGRTLQRGFRDRDILVVWGKFPQGLPFYAWPVIQAQRRPYLGQQTPNEVPLKFPGNRERFGRLLLADEAAFYRLLEGSQRVWVVGDKGTFERAQERLRNPALRRILRSGRWELFVNR